MNNEQFNVIVDKQIESIRRVLTRKATEYTVGSDRLHNFRVAARKLGTTPAHALLGMDIKHVVSIEDAVNGLPATLLRSDIREYLDEKIGDHINYMILLKACLYEQYGETDDTD